MENQPGYGLWLFYGILFWWRKKRQENYSKTSCSDSSICCKKCKGTISCSQRKLFNLLPSSLRGMNSEHVDFFKNHVDIFLSSIPDQSTHAGLGWAAETNTLLHQIPLFYAMTWYHPLNFIRRCLVIYYIFNIKVDSCIEKPRYCSVKIYEYRIQTCFILD